MKYVELANAKISQDVLDKFDCGILTLMIFCVQKQ